MKKIYLALFMFGLFLLSCGGEGKSVDRKEKIKDYEYTRDKDEALELAEKLLDVEKKMHKERLDADKKYKEKEDELLKDYDGKERKLIKMAKTGDETALNTLTELRKIGFTRELRIYDFEKSIYHPLSHAFRESVRDIRELNDANDLKDWEKDMDKIEEKRNKEFAKFYKKREEILRD